MLDAETEVRAAIEGLRDTGDFTAGPAPATGEFQKIGDSGMLVVSAAGCLGQEVARFSVNSVQERAEVGELLVPAGVTGRAAVNPARPRKEYWRGWNYLETSAGALPAITSRPDGGDFKGMTSLTVVPRPTELFISALPPMASA